MSTVEKKVVSLIASQLGVDESKVAVDSKIVEDLGADSLDRVELTMAVEDEFGVQIPDARAEKMTTVGEVIKYIEEEQA